MVLCKVEMLQTKQSWFNSIASPFHQLTDRPAKTHLKLNTVPRTEKNRTRTNKPIVRGVIPLNHSSLG
jgi:hypothetical protein